MKQFYEEFFQKFAALPAEDKATVEQVRKEIDAMAGPAHAPADAADKKPTDQ